MPMGFAFAACCVCLFSVAASAQTTLPAQGRLDTDALRFESRKKKMAEPDPAAKYRWREVAQSIGWTSNDMDAIARDKIIFPNEEFARMYLPYARTRLPVFITSDSVLAAYNVLFEASIRRVETANGRALLPILKSIYAGIGPAALGLTGKPKLADAAKLRAQAMIAVAIELLGDHSLALDAKLAPVVAGEVGRVREAKGMQMPDWLGPADADFLGLDYSRFTPRGFYTQSPELENYFRAVSWLQAIPFRVSNDREFLSALLIGVAAQKKEDKLNLLYRQFDSLLGDPDDPDLRTLARLSPGQLTLDLDKPDGLGDVRKSFLADLRLRGPLPRINDMLSASGQPAVTLRLLSARRTPDSILFGKVMAGSPDPLPSGLEVAAALGSRYATQRLIRPLKLDRPLFDAQLVGYDSLYCDYLNCLQALADPPEKDAPQLFSSRLWQAKQCQTVLSGWANIRHAWVLQAKGPIFGGRLTRPGGFVEPVPEFFSRMAALCNRTRGLLDSAGASDPDLDGWWGDLGDISLRLNAIANKQLRGQDFNANELEVFNYYGSTIADIIMMQHLAESLEPPDDAPRIADVYHNVQTNEYLEVGIGRPRALYVLYPYHGGEVLCEGAVMPYYEFPHAAPMTDSQWKAMLDSKSPPKPLVAVP